MALSPEDEREVQDIVDRAMSRGASYKMDDGLRFQVSWLVVRILLGVLALFGTTGYFFVDYIATNVSSTTAETQAGKVAERVANEASDTIARKVAGEVANEVSGEVASLVSANVAREVAMESLRPTVESALRLNPEIIATAFESSGEIGRLRELRDAIEGSILISSSEVCPPPFEKYADLDGRFVLGARNEDEAGDVGGVPFEENGAEPSLIGHVAISNLPLHGHIMSFYMRPNDINEDDDLDDLTAVEYLGTGLKNEVVVGGSIDKSEPDASRNLHFAATYGVLLPIGLDGKDFDITERLSAGGKEASEVAKVLGLAEDIEQPIHLSFPYMRLLFCVRPRS